MLREVQQVQSTLQSNRSGVTTLRCFAHLFFLLCLTQQQMLKLLRHLLCSSTGGWQSRSPLD